MDQIKDITILNKTKLHWFTFDGCQWRVPAFCVTRFFAVHSLIYRRPRNLKMWIYRTEASNNFTHQLNCSHTWINFRHRRAKSKTRRKSLLAITINTHKIPLKFADCWTNPLKALSKFRFFISPTRSRFLKQLKANKFSRSH